jgi:predicted GIY-YIG superfamily endonuclease
VCGWDYYTGSTTDLERRFEQHQRGEGARHTARRLLVKLVYCEFFDRVADAFAREKQVQGWTRKKKEALIAGDTNLLHEFAACQNESHYSNYRGDGFGYAQPSSGSILGDCCEIVSGSTPSTNVESFWNGNICWVTPKDLSHLNGAYISDTPRKLTQSGLDSCGASILPSNSVLFSSRAPIGHVAINSVPMATNQGFKSFVPKDNRVNAKFLYHWLRKIAII